METYSYTFHSVQQNAKVHFIVFMKLPVMFHSLETWNSSSVEVMKVDIQTCLKVLG